MCGSARNPEMDLRAIWGYPLYFQLQKPGGRLELQVTTVRTVISSGSVLQKCSSAGTNPRAKRADVIIDGSNKNRINM